MTPQNAKAAVARHLAVVGVAARLPVHRSDWLSHDRRPVVFVREPVPPVAQAAVLIALGCEVRIIFTSADQRGAA